MSGVKKEKRCVDDRRLRVWSLEVKVSEDKYIFLTNTRTGWSPRRPMESIEAEMEDEKRRTK